MTSDPTPNTPAPNGGPSDFRAAYATLARIADELDSGEADLDRVLPLLEEAQAAYAVCRARIEAVRRVLGTLDGDAPVGQDDDEDEEDEEDEDDEDLF